MLDPTQLSRRVYDELLDRLLTGRLRPGEVFNRRQIAAEMGVSLSPVLEAMRQLQSEGLIEAVPRQGTRVCLISPEKTAGQLLVREALECQAGRLYCGEPVARQMNRLRPLAARVDATDHHQPDNWKDDVRFHHALVMLADVPALIEAFDRVMKVGLFYMINALTWSEAGVHPEILPAARRSHVRLLQDLTHASPDETQRLLREHLRAGKEDLFARILHRSTPAGVADSPDWL